MHVARFAKAALISTLAIAMTTEAFAVDAAATRALNLRTGPGTGYAVIDTLYSGENVNVIECDGFGWCFVDRAGPDGWVSARYLTSATYPVDPPVVRAPPRVVHAPQPNYDSQSDDAAAALAFAAILGIGAVMIGSAIAGSNDNQTAHNPPPHRPNGSRSCPPGSVWSWQQRVCVAY
jgi:hypothetical protein